MSLSLLGASDAQAGNSTERTGSIEARCGAGQFEALGVVGDGVVLASYALDVFDRQALLFGLRTRMSEL